MGAYHLSLVAEPHDSQGILKGERVFVDADGHRVAEPHDSQGILKVEGSVLSPFLPAPVAEPHDSQGILKGIASTARATWHDSRRTPRFAGNTERTAPGQEELPVPHVAEPHDSQGILKAPNPVPLVRMEHHVVAEPHDSQGILKGRYKLLPSSCRIRRRTPRFAGNTERRIQPTVLACWVPSQNPTIRREY